MWPILAFSELFRPNAAVFANDDVLECPAGGAFDLAGRIHPTQAIEGGGAAIRTSPPAANPNGLRRE